MRMVVLPRIQPRGPYLFTLNDLLILKQMKHYQTLTRERDEALMTDIRREIARGDGHPRSVLEIVRKVASEKAPRFFVEYDYALRTLRRMQRRPVEWKVANVGAMWTALHNEVATHMNRHKSSLEDALAAVLQRQTAPSYFCNPSTLRRIYFKTRARAMHARRQNRQS